MLLVKLRKYSILKEIVELVSHHEKTILEFVGVPLVEVTLLVVIDFDNDLGACVEQVLGVGHIADHLSGKYDVTLELLSDQVSFVDEGQHDGELLLEGRELSLSLLDRNLFTVDTLETVSLVLLAFEFFLFDLPFHLDSH